MHGCGTPSLDLDSHVAVNLQPERSMPAYRIGKSAI
jgi:hypothetical protein